MHRGGSPSRRGAAEGKVPQRDYPGRQRGLDPGDWFLPKLFPASLDGSLTASDLCTFLSKFLVKSKTSLANFIKSSCALSSPSTAQQCSSELWPCSIPPLLPPPRTRLAARRRARWELRSLSRLWTRHMVAAGNWLVLGRPGSFAADLPPLSAQQLQMLDRLERQATIWIRLGRGPKRGLDRAVQKFDHMHDQLQQLQSLSSRLFSSMQPYNRVSASGSNLDQRAGSESPERRTTSTTHTSLRAGSSTTSLRIDPKRLKFECSPSFKADRYLVDPLLRSGLKDPRVFRRPSSSWEKPKLARVQSSQTQLLELFRKWDSVDSLYLMPASDSEHRYRCGLFAVYKNDLIERQILNPIPENSRSDSVSEATLSLAHASLLSQVFIPPGSSLVINSDDLKDFYHALIRSRAPAPTAGMQFFFRELQLGTSRLDFVLRTVRPSVTRTRLWFWEVSSTVFGVTWQLHVYAL